MKKKTDTKNADSNLSSGFEELVDFKEDAHNYLKKLSDLIPLISLIVLMASVASIMSYFSVFGLQPFRYIEITDLIPNLLQYLSDLIGLITASLLAGLIFLFFVSRFEKPNINKALVIYFLTIIIILVIFRQYEKEISLNTSVGSMWSRLLFIILFYSIFSTNAFLKYFFYEIDKELTKGPKGSHTREEWVIIRSMISYMLNRILMVLLLVYFPVDTYFQGKEIQKNILKRNIMLVTNSKIILPYDKNNYIIGSTSKFYFCYNNLQKMTTVISRENVKLECVLDKPY